jgi:hypothetical protein
MVGAGVVIAVVAFAIVGQRLGWVDLRGHGGRGRDGMGGTLAGLGDELFHPTRHEVQVELDRQTIVPAPAPIPGDRGDDVFSGTVRIDL